MIYNIMTDENQPMSAKDFAAKMRANGYDAELMELMMEPWHTIKRICERMDDEGVVNPVGIDHLILTNEIRNLRFFDELMDDGFVFEEATTEKIDELGELFENATILLNDILDRDDTITADYLDSLIDRMRFVYAEVILDQGFTLRSAVLWRRMSSNFLMIYDAAMKQYNSRN